MIFSLLLDKPGAISKAFAKYLSGVYRTIGTTIY